MNGLLADTSILVRLSDYGSPARQLCEQAVLQSVDHQIPLYPVDRVRNLAMWCSCTPPSQGGTTCTLAL